MSYIYRILLCLFAALAMTAVTGCESEMPEPAVPQDREIPVEFHISCPPGAVPTRAYTVADKTEFKDGDVIHISALFTLRDKDGNRTTVRKYNYLTYSGNRWVSKTEDGQTPLTWPWNAVDGSFEAYYIPGDNNNGYLAEGASTEVMPLSGNYLKSDPLYGNRDGVEYGCAVNIQFQHLTSRLVIVNTANDNADEYWLHQENIMNRYVLTRNADDTLVFGFSHDAGSNDGSVASTKQADGAVVFYLAPGDYSQAKLNYRYSRPYLSLGVSGMENLEGNHSYCLDIESSLGVIDETENKDPWEPDPEPPVKFGELDIEKFLAALANGDTYVLDDGTSILEKDASGHLMLVRDVDFQHQTFTPRDLPNSVVLHGNYHSVVGLSRPLFITLSGTVNNIGLRDAEIDGFLSANSEVGALACRCDGYVDNVMLDNISVKASAPENPNLVTSAGGLLGNLQSGGVHNVTVRNTLTVELGNRDAEMNGNVCLGGIIGQSAAPLQGVRMASGADGSDPQVRVVNKCVSPQTGNGVLATGGVVGLLTTRSENISNRLSDCIISVTVDCSQSKALQNYAGGLAGQHRSGDIYDCHVSGNVKGGMAKTLRTESGSITPGRAYTGGLVGYMESTKTRISDCKAFADVESNPSLTVTSGLTGTNMEAHATGGFVGSVSAIVRVIDGCMAWGDVRRGTGQERDLAGSFAGVSPNSANQEGNKTNPSSALPFCGNAGWTL